MNEMNKLYYSDFKLVAYLTITCRKEFTLAVSKLLKHIVESGIIKETEFSTREDLSAKLKGIPKILKDKICDQYYLNLLSRDLELISSKLGMLIPETSVDRLIEIGSKSIQVLNQIFNSNVTISPIVNIVDNFPEPYDKVSTWDFMFADEEDYKKYNIEVGLYIHTRRQFPYYSEVLIIHEYVHFLFNELKAKTSESLYRWVEEGLADWFSLKTHYEMFKDIEAIDFAKNMNLIYSESFTYSTLAEYQSYNDILQEVFKAGGHKAILDLAKKYLDDPESEYWAELFDDIKSMKFNLIFDFKHSFEIKNQFDFIISTNKQQYGLLNVASIEYLILANLKNKMTLDDIRKKTQLNIEVLKAGLGRLLGRGYILKNENDNFEVIKNIYHLIKSGHVKVNFEWKQPR